MLSALDYGMAIEKFIKIAFKGKETTIQHKILTQTMLLLLWSLLRYLVLGLENSRYNAVVLKAGSYYQNGWVTNRMLNQRNGTIYI